jgi:hypothetical protein
VNGYDITDGTSNTIMMIEKAGWPDFYVKGKLTTMNIAGWPYNSGGRQIFWYGPWAGYMGEFLLTTGADGTIETETAGACWINCNNKTTPYSFHSGGICVSFADGSIRFIRDSLPEPTFSNLIQIDDGQVIGNY